MATAAGWCHTPRAGRQLAGQELDRPEVVDGDEDVAGPIGETGDAGEGDEAVEGPAGPVGDGVDRLPPACGCPEIGNDVRIAEIDTYNDGVALGSSTPPSPAPCPTPRQST